VLQVAASADTARPSPGLRPTATTAPTDHTGKLRRNIIIAALVATLIVVAGGLMFGLVFTAATAPSAPVVDAPAYPSVDGPVGENLEELQRSVAP
ncbi:MAG: hypothetical protein Q7J04_04275, partial [Microcella sp.]|nr:hypothetical protein [Microcella sp.]